MFQSYIPGSLQMGPMMGYENQEGVIHVNELKLFECFATGTFEQNAIFELACGPICQRPDNPCIVDIDFTIAGDGIYELVPEYCLFSLDTTNGTDGTWHILQPVETDPLHCGQFIEVHGTKVCRFVADMCDHISSFFSEPRICFRITVKEKVDVDSTFGAFDAAGNPTPATEPETINPTVAPSGGCRQLYFGNRLERQ